MKTFLAYTDCSDSHPFEYLTQLVPLVQSLQDGPLFISTRPHDFHGDWGVSFFETWEAVLRVNSFTDEGKMVWVKACVLETECKQLIDSFSCLDLHANDNIWDGKLLTVYKNWQFYHLLEHHCQPCFQENITTQHIVVLLLVAISIPIQDPFLPRQL